MADLGKAYVQIMPSAKGISGSIQKAIAPEAERAGRSAGGKIASSLSNAMSSAGSKLTKAITVPVMGAATAVSGLVGALGFKRLIGLDTAQAKLKGLGYSAEEVERISGQVETAIMDGMTTMGEGVDIAAGALAAGVKEGAALERYITLVGDAAVGANRPVDEMAQIFNRVQGGGRLMTQELNMIEMGLPGFAQAMANELAGGSLDAFRTMVTNGEVGSEEFLDVMDDFAGGMAEACSESWAGMAKNTLAYVGIIGESLLEGVFEDGKKGLADFIELLKSDEVQEWAVQTGEKIRELAQGVAETIKTLFEWWNGLSEGFQSFIGIFAGLMVAIGPIMMIGSKLINGFKMLSPLITAIQTGLGLLAGVFTAISAPILAVVGIVAGLVALFVALYNSNEEFRELVGEVWESIKETMMGIIETIVEFVTEIFGGFVEWWNENQQLILETISVVWETIQNIIMAAMDVIVPILQTAWEGIKNTIEAVWNVISTIIETAINLVMGIIKTVMQIITGDWSGAWNTIKSTVSGVLSGIQGIISGALNAVLSVVTGILNTIKSTFSSIFNGLKGVVTSAFTGVKSAVKSGITAAYNTVTGFASKFLDAGKNIVTSIADGIKGAIGKVTDAIGNVASKVRDFLPFSPPKTGPLMDIMDVQWGETIAGGIEKGENDVTKAMDEILNFDVTRKATFSGANNQDEDPNYYNSSQQNQPIYLQVDGKTFARLMGDYTSQEGGNRIRRIERGLA